MAAPTSTDTTGIIDHATTTDTTGDTTGANDRQDPSTNISTNTSANTSSNTSSDSRTGTILSATINILSTMVGGGSLSLPLAFGQAGIAIVAPLTLLVVAATSWFCMWCLVQAGNGVAAAAADGSNSGSRQPAGISAPEPSSSRQRGDSNNGGPTRQRQGQNDRHQDEETAATEAAPQEKGKLSYELIASAAFGPLGHSSAMILVSVVCYFATVGYAVLLRDLLEPFADYAHRHWFTGGGGNGTSNSTDSGGSGSGIVAWYSDVDRRASEDEDLIFGIGRSDSINYFSPFTGTDTADDPTITSGPTLARNMAMCTIVVLMTPFCLLTNLTALRNVGLLSMGAVLVLGCIIVWRSVQCNFGGDIGANHVFHSDWYSTTDPILPTEDISSTRHDRSSSWYDYITYVPPTLQSFFTAFPIFISCFICHYNVPPIHNELQNPTSARVGTWLKSTILSSTTFYLVVGVAGSMYGNCTPSGTVSGNILLDFDEDDVLLLVGRSCLALTIALAFPMLVIPPRDIVLRAFYGGDGGGSGGSGGRGGRGGVEENGGRSSRRPPSRSFHLLPFGRIGGGAMDDDEEDNHLFEPVEGTIPSAMTQPLLLDHDDGWFDPEAPSPRVADAEARDDKAHDCDDDHVVLDGDAVPAAEGTTCSRAVAAVSIFWSGAAVACSVKSIDVVWDLLGSSLSICLGFLIPCASYLVLCPMVDDGGGDGYSNCSILESFSRSIKKKLCRIAAWTIIIVLSPMMVICTCNAAYNTFLR